MIETLDDIVEEIANKLNVYGAHVDGEKLECRVCFTMGLKMRIKEANRIERSIGLVEEYNEMKAELKRLRHPLGEEKPNE